MAAAVGTSSNNSRIEKLLDSGSVPFFAKKIDKLITEWQEANTENKNKAFQKLTDRVSKACASYPEPAKVLEAALQKDQKPESRRIYAKRRTTYKSSS